MNAGSTPVTSISCLMNLSDVSSLGDAMPHAALGPRGTSRCPPEPLEPCPPDPPLPLPDAPVLLDETIALLLLPLAPPLALTVLPVLPELSDADVEGLVSGTASVGASALEQAMSQPMPASGAR